MLVVAVTSACAAPTPVIPRTTIGADLDLTVTPPPRAFPPQEVLVVGDSIMVGVAEYGGLPELLALDAWTLEVVAEQSRTVPWATEQVRQRATVPPYVVVGMGSNPGPGLGGFPSEVATLFDELRVRGARRVVWIPPHHLEADRYAERVEALRALESRRFIVADWPAYLAEHPEWLQGDGLHLTSAGAAALAAFIREQLAALR